jgi:hypothetical protein
MPMNQTTLETKLAEFDNSFPAVALLMNQLGDLVARHVASGGAINRRLDRGDKNTAAQSRELRAVFDLYPSALKNLGNNCLKLAAQAEEIQKLL